MEKLLVAVFDAESAAFDGVKALEDLSATGEITLYADAVIAKDSSGTVEMKREPKGGSATIFGSVVGGLIGLLGGPVGAVAGVAAGAYGGVLVDLTRYDFSAEFVSEVAESLIPGRSAVLADIDETWMAPVDTRLGQLGGVVFRRPTSEVVEDQLSREAAELSAELDALDAELAQADAETRAALEGQMKRTKERAEALRQRVQDNLDRAKRETDAKIQTLREQAQHADAERKANIERRMADAEADLESRRQKLEQARPLITEALRP